jgi:hypothetical protein
MRQIQWAAIPGVNVLVPESAKDRKQLAEILQDKGVRDGTTLARGRFAGGLLHIPARIRWEADGAASVTITPQNAPARPRPALFWVVAGADGTGEPHVWWGLDRDADEVEFWE